MRQENNKLMEVSLLPHPDPVPFDKAVQLVADLCKQLGVDQQRFVQQRLSEWRKSKPSAFSVSTKALVGYRVLSYLEIRPVLGDNLTPKGWYVAMDITYCSDHWDEQKELDPEVWHRLNKGKMKLK